MSGDIVTDAHNLLGLVEADYAVLVTGQAAKVQVLGSPNQHREEIMKIAEFLKASQLWWV